MGILGKIIGAGASLVGAGAQAIGKGIENAFLKQEKKNLEYISKYPYAHKYIIREVKHRMEDMVFAHDLGIEQDFFVVYDVSNQPIFIAKPLTPAARKYVIIDVNGSEIARIECKKALLSSTKYSCIISSPNGDYQLGTNVSFDKRKFSLEGIDMKISCNDTGKEIKVYKQRKTVMQINKVPSDLGLKWGEYVLGCNEKAYTNTLILFSLGIGIMLIESENLLDTK